jgi:starch synthase
MTGVDAEGLDDAIGRATRMWREPQRWRRIQANGMARPFGWEASAKQYVQVYARALQDVRELSPPAASVASAA